MCRTVVNPYVSAWERDSYFDIYIGTKQRNVIQHFEIAQQLLTQNRAITACRDNDDRLAAIFDEARSAVATELETARSDIVADDAELENVLFVLCKSNVHVHSMVSTLWVWIQE